MQLKLTQTETNYNQYTQKTSKMKKIYTLLLASIILTSIQAQSIDLSFKLEKGKEYKHITSTKSTVAQNMMGQDINMTMTVNGATSFLVKNITNDNYEMDATYDELSMTIEMPQGKQSYSSEVSDVNDQVSSLLRNIKGKTIEVVMSKTGKVKEVRNTKVLEQTINESFEQLPEEERAQVKAQVMEAFGDETIKRNMESVSGIYPDKPVKKGDKWIIDTSIDGDVKIKLSTEYELVDFTSECALIKGYATIEPLDSETASMIPMNFEFSGSQMSELKIDINTGWIIDAKITQEIEGEVEMNMGENQEIKGMEGGMKISMKMVQETVITN